MKFTPLWPSFPKVLVNTYGLPRYQEANPALFTIVTCLHSSRIFCILQVGLLELRTLFSELFKQSSMLGTLPKAFPLQERISIDSWQHHSLGYFPLPLRCHVRRHWPRFDVALRWHLCCAMAGTLVFPWRDRIYSSKPQCKSIRHQRISSQRWNCGKTLLHMST